MFQSRPYSSESGFGKWRISRYVNPNNQAQLLQNDTNEKNMQMPRSQDQRHQLRPSEYIPLTIHEGGLTEKGDRKRKKKNCKQKNASGYLSATLIL